jgi:hypothetical protein
MMRAMAEKREVVQVTVRVPAELHRRFRRIVFERDTSIQEQVGLWIARYVEHHERGERDG